MNPPNWFYYHNDDGVTVQLLFNLTLHVSSCCHVTVRWLYFCVSIIPLELPVLQREVMERSASGGFAGRRPGNIQFDRWAFRSKPTALLSSKFSNCWFWHRVHPGKVNPPCYTVSSLTLFPSDGRISANTILCFCCGMVAFKELAYKYRQNIPPSELPG